MLLIIGVLLLAAAAALDYDAMNAPTLVLSGTAVQSAVMQAHNSVNMLHGPAWGACSTLGFRRKCKVAWCFRHETQLVENPADMQLIAWKRNMLRASTDVLRRAVFAGRQTASCYPPACVGSADDLLLCGGVALSVAEWAKIPAVLFTKDPDSYDRGFVCSTGDFRMWKTDAEAGGIGAFLGFVAAPKICEVPESR